MCHEVTFPASELKTLKNNLRDLAEVSNFGQLVQLILLKLNTTHRLTAHVFTMIHEKI